MHKQYESKPYYQRIIEKIRHGEKLSDRELAKSITLFEQEELYPELRNELLHVLDKAPHRNARLSSALQAQADPAKAPCWMNSSCATFIRRPPAASAF